MVFLGFYFLANKDLKRRYSANANSTAGTLSALFSTLIVLSFALMFEFFFPDIFLRLVPERAVFYGVLCMGSAYLTGFYSYFKIKRCVAFLEEDIDSSKHLKLYAISYTVISLILIFGAFFSAV